MILPYRLEARTTPSRTMQLAVPLIAALLTLVIGFLIFGLVGRDPLEAMHAFFIEPLSSVNGWSELLLKASPLCLIGLGLAIGYRANVWNIGAEGQMLLGGIAASGVAIYFDQATGWWILPTMMIAGVLGGMAWAVHEQSVPVLIVGALLLGSAYGALQNLTLVISFASVSRRHLGLASSIWNVGFDLGSAIGSVVVGAIAVAADFPTALAVTGAFALLTLPLALVRLRQGRQRV